MGNAAGGEHYSVAIVGSGPSGLSAGGRAAQRGVSHVLLEKTDHASDTIYKYQKGKLVMATPDILPLRSDFSFEMGIREDVLGTWDNQLEEHGVNIRYNAEVTGIERRDDNFLITLQDGSTITADNVVLSIGLQGNIRKFNVPGADEATHIQYQLDDPEEYEAESIVVVGAGDAGIENAVGLAKQNTVTMVNRSDEFVRVKDGNRTLILDCIEKGILSCVYSANVVRFGPGSITLDTPDGELEIKCDRVIGRLGAIAPRKFVESCGIEFPSADPTSLPEVSAKYESNVPGLYIIGALAGYPLIKQAMNQGYEVIEFILGNDIKPADEPLLEERFKVLGDVTVEGVFEKILNNLPIFADLPYLVVREMMLEAAIHRPSPGDVIFERNDYTNSFYAIVEGEVEVDVDPSDPSRKAVLGQGDFFGEIGLIAGRRRSATVRARSECFLLEVPRRTMIKMINTFEEVHRPFDQAAIARQISTYIAPNIPAEDLAEVAKSATIRTFKRNEILFEEGDKAEGVHLIRRGSVTVSRRIGGKETVLSYVAAGRYVGEMALLSDAPRTATVRAAVATETVRIEKDAFKRLLDNAPDLRTEIEAQYRDRLVQNERMAQAGDAGGLIQFLVEQGLGEATDVLLIDESLCTRCNNCEVACAETHGGVSRLNREAGPTFANVHVPTSCRHCEHPHCMADCPPDAIHRAPDGEVFIDDSCIGCGNCERNCPYDVIRMAAMPPPKGGLLGWLLFGFGGGPGEDPSAKGEGAKLAVKCDMCKDIDGGAACVRACPTGAAIRVHPEEFMSIAQLTERPG